MTVTPRNRKLNLMVSKTGRRWWLGAWATKSMSVGESKVCDDIVGNFPNVNTFSLHTLVKQTPALTGTLYKADGSLHSIWEQYPIGYHANNPAYPSSVYPDPTTGELNDLGWEVLSKCNPAQAHVPVPSFLGELKDLPELIRGWGIGLLGRISKGYLTWRWCAKPMISDVSKMLHFMEAANKRFRELRRLRDVGYIRRRCNLGTDSSASKPYNVLLHSEAVLLHGVRQNRFTRKRWGSVNWKVQSSSPILDMEDRKLFQFTRETMSGINSYGALAAAWELLPWSWFYDWFSNTGTLISATNNAVGCTWSRACIMETSTSEALIYVREDEPEWVRGFLDAPFHWARIHKARYPALPIIPFPTPYMPTLTGKHWSILASLAALRLS